jgi:FtsP/CotA-like multicopper oxidase with cupredoxin domain
MLAPAFGRRLLMASLSATAAGLAACAQQMPCVRPAPGSTVTQPEELRSHDGVLKVDLTYRNIVAPDGQQEYCYQSGDGSEAPTLRLQPGDLLILHLKNALTALPPTGAATLHHAAVMPISAPCASGQMTALSTNLHFHGMTVPAVCHEDDVLHTAVQPSETPFAYRFRIPADEPPGVYWYHPHIHGVTNAQVLGGASGAMIVDGIERANRQLAGLHEQLFVIRDLELLHPGEQPAKNGLTPPVFRDAEGDILNTGTGGGKPAKDLSVNFVPVPYPDYPPAQMVVRPAERQLWRILNASAITYIDLQLLAGNAPQPIGVVSLDGVPINENGMMRDRILWTDHVFLPPAARVEFIFKGLPAGAQAKLITRSVDTGPAGENDPARPLANVLAAEHAPEPPQLAASPAPLAAATSVWLGNVKPVRTRKLFFSERPEDPNVQGSPTVFMITEDGKAPAPYDPHAAEPDITVHDGDVEEWTIENRSTEAHTFHIHQVHFMLTQWNGVPLDEPFLRDTINVPYWKGPGTPYPSLTLRMDFRNPNAVGTFVYHCHLLEHEDGGMMGTIRVLPKTDSRGTAFRRQ